MKKKSAGNWGKFFKVTAIVTLLSGVAATTMAFIVRALKKKGRTRNRKSTDTVSCHTSIKTKPNLDKKNIA